MTKPLRKILGLNGVARNEYKIARKTGGYFEWVMFAIAVCLPFYWYSDAKNLLPLWLHYAFLWFIWIAFTTELITITALVKNKKFYLRSNWLNILIIVFTFPVSWLHLPFVVLFRLLRILILMRVLVPWWERQKAILAKNHLSYTLIAFCSIVLIGGALVSLFDTGIKDPISGVWWAVQTITTVGYGDVVPETFFGRLFAILIMVMGIALITILTANFSAYLLERKEEKIITQQEEILRVLENMEKRLKKIESKIKK